MSDNRIIPELSDDELLAIARGAKVETVIVKISEAAKFIYAKGIRDGRESISAMLVFHTYRVWKGFDNKRQAKRHFFKDFNKYFTPYRTKDGLHYMLDARSFDTSREEYFRMRADLKHEKSRKKNKA
jgi:hypothetical protein